MHSCLDFVCSFLPLWPNNCKIGIKNDTFSPTTIKWLGKWPCKTTSLWVASFQVNAVRWSFLWCNGLGGVPPPEHGNVCSRRILVEPPLLQAITCHNCRDQQNDPEWKIIFPATSVWCPGTMESWGFSHSHRCSYPLAASDCMLSVIKLGVSLHRELLYIIFRGK